MNENFSRHANIKIRRERLLSGVTRLRILGTPFFIDRPSQQLPEVFGLWRHRLIVWEEIPDGQPVMQCKLRRLRELRNMPHIRTPEQQSELFQSDQIEMFGGPH